MPGEFDHVGDGVAGVPAGICSVVELQRAMGMPRHSADGGDHVAIRGKGVQLNASTMGADDDNVGDDDDDDQ